MTSQPFDPERHPHRRLNALTGEWVLVSPHRSERPWLGQLEPAPAENGQPYDATCSLCPGNRRASGVANPDYRATFAFDNDFSALLSSVPSDPPNPGPAGALFTSQPVAGACRVLCFSPRHDLTLADMPEAAIVDVIDMWAAETAALGRSYRWVQVFENRGAAMGCSNPHPHGQVWASNLLPNEADKEDRRQRDHFERTGSLLLVDYVGREADLGTRVVRENRDFLAVVPYWAIWPYETMILAKRPVARLPDLPPEQRASLAALLRGVLAGYDRLFGVSAPYSMGWHGAPYAAEGVEHWQLHAHVYPPLLRSATVRKHMVGYELLSEPQRDLTPERAAERLRAASR
jgi:UDPglucose--hexose-1-phosphate uridylyltransferase